MALHSQTTTAGTTYSSRSRLHALAPFIARERLLDRLPDADGHVLWLSAPYGYGKSVLLAQWAAGLEEAGHSVVWLSAEHEDVRSGVAAQLALPASAPWPLLLDELARRGCAVVIEEAEAAGEALDRLLAGFDGLVAVASRGELASLELPRRLTQGRLLRLGEAEMAFTPAEVEALSAQLGGDDGASQGEALELWRRCGGWPLALHFALLSGGAPALDSLAETLSQALPFQLRGELLLLAAVGELPRAASDGRADRLVERGLAQELTSGYRLHPLVRQALMEQHALQAAEQVRAAGDRLPWALRAGALTRLGLVDELAAVLAEPASLQHALTEPAAWLDWHAQAPGADAPERRLAAVAARVVRTDFGAAVPELLALLLDSGLAPDDLTRVAARAVAALAAARRLDEATAVATAAAATAAAAGPQRAWELRHAQATAHLQSGRLREAWELLSELVEEAAVAGVDPAARLAAEVTLHLTRFELDGDHFAYAAALRDLIKRRSQAGGHAATTLHHNLAINLYAVGDVEGAREHLLLAATTADRHAGLVVAMAQAFVDRDLERFPQLLAESRLWEYDLLTERVAALWLRTLRAVGDAELAAEVAEGLPEGPFVLLEKAWQAFAAGDGELAAERLARALPAWQAQASLVNRDFRQHHAAMDFIINGGEDRLEALLALSPHRQRVLPALLVPLASLPRDRPELSVHYPIDEVLASGWREAVEKRQGEVPPLELKLLGEVGARMLGEELRLSRRHRELLTLIALRVPRSRWAEELWPEAAPKSSENNLRVQLHLLKRELSLGGEQHYLPGEELTNTESDLERLQAALAAGDAEAVGHLYSGPLAPEVDLETVTSERAELARRVVTCLSQAARGVELEPAIAYLRRALDIEPFDEELLRSLVERLLAAGRRGAAERAARAFEQRLEAETGYSLSPQTVDLLR